MTFIACSCALEAPLARHQRGGDQKDSRSLANLRDELPIHCTDGQLRPPVLLYHPDSKLAASLLGSAIGFPDLSIYSERSDLWLEFFEGLGMARALRPSDIINAIDEVIASKQSDEEKAVQLTDIGEYVDQHWDEPRSRRSSMTS